VLFVGFIDLFGIEFQGSKALLATTISNWAAAYTGAYIFILLLGSWPADILGRKLCLLFVQVFLACACLCEMFAQTWQLWLVSKIFAVGRDQILELGSRLIIRYPCRASRSG
jgi:MFS family permease